MRETLGTIIVVLAILSYFKIIDTVLCVHTAKGSYCTAQRAQAQKEQK